MKKVSALLGALVLLVCAGWFYEHMRASRLEAKLMSLLDERELHAQELKRLNQRFAELQGQSRSTASVPSAAAPTGKATAETAITTPQAPVPPERPGITRKAPPGWTKNGAKAESYLTGVDANETWGGMASAYVESLTPKVEGGFGGMMQTISADSYAGKRVRLSGWIKTADANEGGGHLWMRVDGQERGQMLGFDNMDNRPVRGTSDWQEASVVLDVPAGAKALNYGFFVSGGGKMWVNGQRIEVVAPEVPTTDMLNANRQNLPSAPRNLGFDPAK